MKFSSGWWIVVGLLLVSIPAGAGELQWSPGGPALVLSLGGGPVRRTLELPSGASVLQLTLKKFLLEDDRLQLIWKSDGELWMRQVKKIPGEESTALVDLPPGHQITLEIHTLTGTPVASIKLQRK